MKCEAPGNGLEIFSPFNLIFFRSLILREKRAQLTCCEAPFIRNHTGTAVERAENVQRQLERVVFDVGRSSVQNEGRKGAVEGTRRKSLHRLAKVHFSHVEAIDGSDDQ